MQNDHRAFVGIAFTIEDGILFLAWSASVRCRGVRAVMQLDDTDYEEMIWIRFRGLDDVLWILHRTPSDAYVLADLREETDTFFASLSEALERIEAQIDAEDAVQDRGF